MPTSTYTVTIEDTHKQRVRDAFQPPHFKDPVDSNGDSLGLTEDQVVEHYLAAYVRGTVLACEQKDASSTAVAGVSVPDDLSTV